MQYTPQKEETPIWQKKLISTEEAIAYFGIGQNKLSELCSRKGCGFCVWYEGRRLIRREKMEAYLDREYSI